MAEDYATELEKFASEIAGADRFLILTHRRPDGDTVGSATALCLALRMLGKTAFVAENPEMTDRLRRCCGALVQPGEYVFDTVVSVDASAPGQLPDAFGRYLGEIDFVIDHHARTTMPFRRSLLRDPTAAATGEIIFDLIRRLGVPFDSGIAEALYIAIATDTGCFLYSNTTSRTHAAAAELLKYDIGLPAVNREFFEKRSRARIALERLVYNDMRFYAGGKIAAITVTLAMRAQTGAAEDDIEDLSALTRKIEGVEAGISAYEQEGGSTKLSLRTSERVDASKVCAALGGGGHPRAAGCRLELAPDDAVKAILAELENCLK